MWVLKDGDDWMVLVALDDDVGGGDDDDSSQWFCSCFLVDLGQCFCLTDTIQDADADAARRINSRNFIFQMFDKTFFFNIINDGRRGLLFSVTSAYFYGVSFLDQHSLLNPSQCLQARVLL